MSRHRVETLAAGSLSIGGSTAHHLIRVLRVKPGRRIVLFDGQGNEAAATVLAVAAGRVEVEVEPPRPTDREPPREITLAFALSKGDKPEWICQKAVELGATRIVVFSAERSVARWAAEQVERKLARLFAVVEGAAAQSGRAALPPVLYAETVATLCASAADAPHRLVLAPGPSEPLTAALSDLSPGALWLATGPEGGLTPEEIEAFVVAGWRAVHLGPRILRAETATLTALALAQGLTGGLS
jgi:16S rRNA (uracil1498-N3)-methyltransferase